jgi:hypothetical protein
MQFIIDSITSYTAKSNLVTYQIVGTNTKLDGCIVQGYAPKSVALYLGSMNVPYFVANGIFGFNRLKNIKSLEKQIQTIAPNGKKRTWRAEVPQLFDEIAKLNIEEPEEERGEFVGKPGEQITIMVKTCECVHSYCWTSSFGWRHNGHGWERPHGTKCIWKIVDMNDAVYMFSTSGNKTNEFLSNIGQGSILETKVDYHSTFRGLRQTWITRPKTAK